MTLSDCTKTDLLWVINQLCSRYLFDGEYCLEQALTDLSFKKEQNRLALEAAEKETKILEGFIQDAKTEIATLTEEKAQEAARATEAAKRAELAEAELAAYKALPWYKKIFG